jgi:hypothetical protein
MSLLSYLTRTRAAVLTLAVGTAALTALPSPAMAATGTFNIVNPNSGRCIGIDTSGYAGIWNCTSNPDQTWHWQNFISARGLTWAELENGNNMCLDLFGGKTSAGTRIIAVQCYGAASQDWTMPVGSGTTVSYIYNLAAADANDPTGFVIGSNGVAIVGVSGGSTANGAALVLWGPVNHPDQFWS